MAGLEHAAEGEVSVLPDEPPDVARVGLDGLVARGAELVRIGVVDGEGGCFSAEPIAWCSC